MKTRQIAFFCGHNPEASLTMETLAKKSLKKTGNEKLVEFHYLQEFIYYYCRIDSAKACLPYCTVSTKWHYWMVRYDFRLPGEANAAKFGAAFSRLEMTPVKRNRSTVT